jgi:hypothetical protein
VARQARQNADERSFPGAIGAQQAEKFALLDVKLTLSTLTTGESDSLGRIGFETDWNEIAGMSPPF